MSDPVSRFLSECEKVESGNPKKSRLPEFLVHKDMVIEALSRGWKIVTVWKVLHEQGKYTGTYPSFAALVRKHIRQSEK